MSSSSSLSKPRTIAHWFNGNGSFPSISKMELVKLVGMSSSTLAKLNNDNYVALEVIDRICQALDCRIEDVVEIKKNPGS
jgi:DNA-binding Xre family transcriptional regulator